MLLTRMTCKESSGFYICLSSFVRTAVKTQCFHAACKYACPSTHSFICALHVICVFHVICALFIQHTAAKSRSAALPCSSPQPVSTRAPARTHSFALFMSIALFVSFALFMSFALFIQRVGQNHMYIYVVYTVLLAGKSPKMQSYTVYIHGSGQP